MINQGEINQLKAETKVGDKFGVYYHSETYTNNKKVVRFTDKSIWFKTEWMTITGLVSSTSRMSWNSLLGYINKNTLRKI